MFREIEANDHVILEDSEGVQWEKEVVRASARLVVLHVAGDELKFSRSTGVQRRPASGKTYRIRPLPQSHVVKNVRMLVAKSRGHEVIQDGPDAYRVVSGASGNEYLVTYLPDEEVRCTCPWGENRPEGVDTACSHRMAVEQFRARELGYRSVQIVGQNADVSRLHRKTMGRGDGIRILARG